jgi:hypothetical protein
MTMTYAIKTKSVFENVYLVAAESEEAARALVEDAYNPPDFFQKHLGETIISATVMTKDSAGGVQLLREQGYY